MNRSNLHSYQERAIDFICEQRKCGLFLDMGLGKTVSALTAVSDLIDSCMIDKVLVIAPLRVCNSVWKQEGAKWEHLSHLKINVCTGSAQRRREALNAPGDVYVINKENVVWLIKEHLKGRWSFDTLIIDESSSFKSPSSKRFRILRKAAPLNQVVILLSGTPSPNGLLDLWSQMHLIDREILGRTITGYKQRFFNADYWGYTWTPKYDAPEKIQNLIKSRVLSMRAEDYIEVPERIDIVETVELPKNVKADYDEFARNLFLQFTTNNIQSEISAENSKSPKQGSEISEPPTGDLEIYNKKNKLKKTKSPKQGSENSKSPLENSKSPAEISAECPEKIEIEAISAAVLANKLLQFANGAIYTDEEEVSGHRVREWKEIHKAKLDTLAEIIEENSGENIIVAYNYRHDLARLKMRFPDAKILDKNPATIDRWNEGNTIRLLLAHPGSCGHGLNLQSGGSMLIFFSLNWNLEYDKQIIARLHRQGQTKPVRVVRIIAAGTIDERVMMVLGQKDSVQSDLLEALR